MDNALSNSSTATKLERMLYWLWKHHSKVPAYDAYIYFQNLDLLYRQDQDESVAALQNISQKVGSLNQRIALEEAIENYRQSINVHNRLFDFSPNSHEGKKELLCLGGMDSTVAQERMDLFDRDFMVDGRRSSRRFVGNITEPGTYCAQIRSASDKPEKESKTNIKVTFDEMDLGNPVKPKVSKKHGGPISISFDELKQYASVIDEKLNTNYVASVLEQKMHCFIQGQDESVFTAEKVCHLVGQVGAGKSTFAKVLTYALADKGYRIFMSSPSIFESIELSESLTKLGVEATPFVGNSTRLDKVLTLDSEAQVSPPEASRILKCGCALQGMSNADAYIEYGCEPCTALHSCEGDTKKRYRCPYYYMCGRTKQDADLFAASVVVSSIQGLGMGRLGHERELLLEMIADNFDLVIVDEADAAQTTLDALFCEVIDVNRDIIQGNKNKLLVENYRDLSLDKKAESRASQYRTSYERLITCATYLSKCITENEKTKKFFTTKYDLARFSWYHLLEKLNPSEQATKYPKLCVRDYEKVEDLLQRNIEKVLPAVCAPGRYVPATVLSQACGLELEIDREDAALWARLHALLLTAAFEQAFFVLSTDAMSVPSEDGLEWLTFNNRRWQQDNFAAAVVDSSFGLSWRNGTLYITKQYITGRSLLWSLPNTRLDGAGHALGPTVLLMSGTSYAPGSARYNLPVPVSYILETPEEKSAYLEKMQFEFPASKTCVSGVAMEKKRQALNALYDEHEELLAQYVDDNGNILVIVNSYEQAQIVAGCFAESFSRDGKAIGYLCKDGGEQGGTALAQGAMAIERKDIEESKLDVLVAPAVVSERGHNIVDDLGNAHYRTLIMFVRPLPVPVDYSLQMQQINGYICQEFYGKQVDNLKLIRSKGYKALEELRAGYSLKHLKPWVKADLYASLFVLIQQLTGRIMRIQNPEQATGAIPRVVFLDGAFTDEDPEMDFRAWTISYLEKLMKEDGWRGEAATNLFNHFLTALKGGNSDEEI